MSSCLHVNFSEKSEEPLLILTELEAQTSVALQIYC